MFFKKNISKLTDEELLQQYTDSGKTEYFGELYNRYIPLLYGLCLKYLSDEARAQDSSLQLFEETAFQSIQLSDKSFQNVVVPGS